MLKQRKHGQICLDGECIALSRVLSVLQQQRSFLTSWLTFLAAVGEMKPEMM